MHTKSRSAIFGAARRKRAPSMAAQIGTPRAEGVRCGLEDRPVDGRPTKEQRQAALAFFEAVLVVMDAQPRPCDRGEVLLSDIHRALGIPQNKNFISPEVNKHLTVVGIEPLEVRGRTNGKNQGQNRGLHRDQVERAIRRLSPPRPNFYRPETFQ